MRSLLKLALILVAGVLIYNYFLGTEAEKEQSKEIFTEVKDLGKAAWGLLKSEKEKFDEGKYDEALDKIGGLISNLKKKAETIQDSDLLDRIADLEDQKAEIERKIAAKEVDSYGNTNSQEDKARQEEIIKDDWEKLLEDTEKVMKDMERE